MKNNIEQFEQHGYCVIKSAVSSELIDFVTQYALFDEMQDFSPDGHQVPSAHAKYADPAMETMLLHLHSILEKNTGLTLYPTYSFYRVYRKGDELIPHKDRPSCEISCTMTFNRSYGNDNYSWPIFMEGDQIFLDPGDLIIYRGCELEHWRKPFDVKDENAWHVQGFFHYVNAAGPYSEYVYDKRDGIGTNGRTPTSSKNYIINL